MAELFVPQGSRSTMGWGKETTFGTAVIPTLWPTFTNFDGPVNTKPVRRAPRGGAGAPIPGTGGRSCSWTADLESDLDAAGMAFAYALGAQTVPSTAIVNTTMASVSTTGDSTITLVTAQHNILPGMKIVVGAESPNPVKSVAGKVITLTNATAASHTVGAAVTLTATGAYVSTMKLAAAGTSLPTFTIQFNRPGSVCTDHPGAKIGSLALSLAPGAGLGIKVSGINKDRLTNGSPTTATVSTKNPVAFEQQFASIVYNGATAFGTGSELSVLGLSVNLNNALTADYFTPGSGNTIRAIPEGQRTVTGSITVGFESQTLRTAFDAARTGGALPTVSLLVPLVSQDVIDATNGVNYGCFIYLPSVFLSTETIKDANSGNLTETLSFEAGESSGGACDNIQIVYIGSSSTAF